MNDGMRRIVRTLIQLVAGGGLTALFLQIAKDVPTSYAPYIVLVSTAIVTCAQIAVEGWKGKDIGVARTSPGQ